MSARESPSSTLANDSQILTLNISSILRYKLGDFRQNCAEFWGIKGVAITRT